MAASSDSTIATPSAGSAPRRHPDLPPHIVDRVARESPDTIYGLWPIEPTSYDAGFRTITYAQLANVVNGLAWWIEEHLGPGRSNQMLTYVGPNDFRVSALVLASIKAGYGLFLTSPRNSPAAHKSLFADLDYKTLITSVPTPAAAIPILETVQPYHLQCPGVDELLSKTYPKYVYAKTLQKGLNDPLMSIHTSGSTGVPKPLIWTNETMLAQWNSTASPAPEGMKSLEQLYLGKRVMVTPPPFHGAGLGQFTFYAIPFGNVVIAPAAEAIVTAQGLVDALKQTPADVALLVPSVVAELAQSPALLDYCSKHLELIVYIGGDLPQAIGDVVADKVPLRCQWGASEVGMPQQLIPAELDPKKDWRFIRFHPCAGAVFEEVADGLFELVIRRDPALASTQTTFTIRGKDLEQLDEYRTKDLFVPHPTVPDAWSWKARADDIIVFLNGEKTNPVTFEQHVVAENPELSGALVVGAQRFQAALLIESAKPCTTTADQAALIERVWPSVQEANRVTPAHARVEKSLIFVAEPDRPLARAGKGTVQRAASLALHAEDIDRIYREAEDDQGDDGELAVPDDADAVAQKIRDGVRSVTDWSGQDDSTSFFEQGMDSLQALQLTRALRRALRRPDLGLSTIYQNPTVSLLTAAVVSAQGERQSDRDLMEPLLATYTGLIHEIPKPSAELSSKETKDVVLTGSTGTLGTYILNALLDRKDIGHVYCLNRGSGGGLAAQGDRFKASNLATAAFQDRVTFLQADLAHPKLGLDETTYETLRTHVGLIINNAWPVNFNLNLTAFRPQMAGVVNLFSLAAATAQRVHVLFVSTVGAVAARPAAAGPAPERIPASLDDAVPNGYGQSKLLSEMLCDAAGRHLGVATSVARVGQVSGAADVPGLWTPKEWFPSLVLSSVHLGCLPDDVGIFSAIDWMPSDLLSDVIVDIASRRPEEEEQGAGARVFNLRNPRTATWASLVPVVRDVARERLGRDLEVVAPAVWLERLQKSDDGEESVAANPAVKLLSFYRDGLWAGGAAAMHPMSVERAAEASPALRDMPAVRPEWMRKWFQEWL
ncbi:putative NRPS-like protein biosynthetic cluster [Pestalotiopsis sp. IQ-011]